MAYSLENKLVVGVSSRVLFDLSKEHKIFEREGIEAYRKYQMEHEKDILAPGVGFSLVKALLKMNGTYGNDGRVEVILMSHNSGDTALRLFHSLKYYELSITRSVLTSGGPLLSYLKAFQTDLFLSADKEEVQGAIDSGIAAGIMIDGDIHTYDKEGTNQQIRLAFDGDAVLFTDESEKIFANAGLEAFEDNERKYAKSPLKEGPFAQLLKTISNIQKEFKNGEPPIRTALVTSRCAPAHERVIRTLRTWDVRVDESFFLGGISKRDVLKAFGAHIFFDDQPVHALSASEVVPSAIVPCKNTA